MKLDASDQTIAFGGAFMSESQPRPSISPAMLLSVALIVVAIIAVLEPVYFLTNPRTITQTETLAMSYTQTQLLTTTSFNTFYLTATSVSTVTGVSQYTPSNPYGITPYNNPNCLVAPFNPYACNEGPPQTIIGYMTSDTCVTLYGTLANTAGTGIEQTYVIWNLPHKYSSGYYQVYGFIYPNWPQIVPFPPHPFIGETTCTGIPVWAEYPYIKAT
jgi:hypothetical protein